MKLAVFATYGNSLVSWREAGILDREMRLYDELAARMKGIVFFGYGTREDLEIAKDYPFLDVCANVNNLHPRLYAIAAPLIHRKRLQNADVFKTNQLYGAHIAYRAARLCRKRLIVRQGYGHYDHRVEESGEDSAPARKALAYERKYLTAADSIVFTSLQMAERAAARHHLPRKKIEIFPNYIDPDLWYPPFRPGMLSDKPFDLIFFGRFAEQKNLEALLTACAGAHVRLTFIGEGPKEDALRTAANAQNIDCAFLPRLPQSEVRKHLRKADAFVLPSHYEGHPKSLIEAMAFGMPILATNTPGIREVLQDGETAIIAEKTVAGLKAGLTRLMELPTEARGRLGEKARQTALSSYSVAAIADREWALIQRLAETRNE